MEVGFGFYSLKIDIYAAGKFYLQYILKKSV